MRSNVTVSPNIEKNGGTAKPNYFLKILKIAGVFLGISLAFLVLATTVSYFIYSKIPNLNSPASILILGKGGEGHTAPDLTDTIMVANFNNVSKKINIVSLPRDIWITEIRAKLNTAYHYGGFKMAGDSVTGVTGLPINYIVVIDFSLFKDLIDTIGGINVDVENSFTDTKYPISGLENDLCNGDKTYACRYETLTFDKGMQKMNGELSLKFVRSRNAVGDEGTDLAREKRQQKVIEAIKERVVSNEVILNPAVIKKLYSVFVSHIETDIDTKTIKILVKFAVESEFNVNFLNIPENILVVSQNDKRYDKQYVFVPKSGTWKDLQEWISKSL